MSSRLIDPRRQIDRATDEQHGVVSQRTLADRQDNRDRFGAEPSRQQNYIIMETVQVFLPNPPISTQTNMMPMFASNTSTMIVLNLSQAVCGQCRLLAARILSSAVVTAGNIFPRFTVVEDLISTDYDLETLNMTSGDIAKADRYEWDTAVQLAQGALWGVSLVTDAGYLPVTNDYQAYVTLGYQSWVST